MSNTHLNSPFIQVGVAKKLCKANGLPIEVGDTVTVYLQDNCAALSGYPTANLIIVRLSEDRRVFAFDRRVAGQDFRFDDIAEIHPQHSCSCQAQCIYEVVTEDQIVSVETSAGSIPITTSPITVNQTGADNLKVDIQNFLNSNHPQTSPLPSVQVYYLPTGGGEGGPALSVTVTASVIVFTTINEGEAEEADFDQTC